MDQSVSLEHVINALRGIPLFSTLDAMELAEIVRVMNVQRLQDGETVFREGDAGEAWHVVFEGKVRVMKDMAGGPARLLATLGPGACFGEIAILDGSPRSASVQASGPVTLLSFRRRPFNQLLDEGSLAAYKLVAAMAQELSRRHRRLTLEISELMHAGEHLRPGHSREEIGSLLDEYNLSE